jgi:hypothetical protein
MAGYFGVDPVLVRLLWLVAMFSGIGFFAYIVFWLIVPKVRTWPPAGYPSGGEASDGALGVSNAMVSGLLIVALAAVLSSHWDGLADLVLPVTLVGFGVYLLNQHARSREPRSAAPGVGGEPLSRDDGAPAATASAPESSPVTRVVLSVLALGLGIAWALRSYGVLHLTIAAAAASALVIVGGGLIASLWFGRSRGLIPLGLVLGSVLLVSSAVEAKGGAVERMVVQSSGGIGQRVYTPTSLAELEDVYSLGLGELTLDLSGLDLAGSTKHVRVEVGMGEAVVIVPADASVEVKAEVGVGKAQMLGLVGEGLGRKLEKTEEGSAPGRLIIEVQIGIGEGTVRRD